MGKRSTQNTKSGRAMNPADQARKEARRRELKKNKKQRQVVREAVIKAKDPKKVIEELERLDQMEYNINEAPPLPDHVLLERRRRLLGNFNRCLSLYEKDDKAAYSDLKKMLAQYHRKHDELKKYYDSVKRAESITVDDIPMPAAPADDVDASMMMEPPLLPVRYNQQGPSVVAASRLLSWEAFSDSLVDAGGKRPPGPPCCPPPGLSDNSDEETDIKEEPDSAESEEEVDDEGNANKLMEDEPIPSASGDDHQLATDTETEASIEMDATLGGATISQIRGVRPGGHVTGRPPFVPPGANFRNVPPPNLMHRFPPGRLGHPGAIPRMMVRPPLGFPPGLGPIGPMAPGLRPPEFDRAAFRPPIPGAPAVGGEPKAMIQAKPQLRNMMAEVTRLIPTSVKVKREEQAKPKPKPVAMGPNTELIPHRPAPKVPPKGSADQAYDDFLKEMQDLL